MSARERARSACDAHRRRRRRRPTSRRRPLGLGHAGGTRERQVVADLVELLVGQGRLPALGRSWFGTSLSARLLDGGSLLWFTELELSTSVSYRDPMDWGAAATILSAGIAFAGILYQQARHWRETRRDKVREAYADWMSALARVRRTEERFLMHSILAQAVVRARAAAGDPLARQGALELTEADWRTMRTIEQEIEGGNRELDITFGKVCLLDHDWRRIKAAEAVRGMETLVEIQPGQLPAEGEFNDRWVAKSKAIGELADLINRTLALESSPSFLWDFMERNADERQEELHARMNTTRRGMPKER